MSIKVGMVTLGCSKNQVDAEHMLADIKNAGYELCTDSGLCDVVIVNTCGFIQDAKQEAIEHILEFAALKDEGRIKAIIVTGCLAERYQLELAKELPEVDAVLGIGSNKALIPAIEQALAGKKVQRFGRKEDLPLEGERIISNLPFYAYIKIAEGCDNCCTYCAIPAIRGKFRSRTIENIVAEAKHFASHGVKELILVAQDTTRYGLDIYGESRLPELLELLSDIDGPEWIRLLYTYPERITDRLLHVIAEQPKIVKYLDIPLQHVSGPVLRRMNRSGDAESYRALIRKIRDTIPGVILRTTFIAGFPGETPEDFELLCSFIKEQRFERLGCFAYSAEEDTPAAVLDGQVDEEKKSRRSDLIMTEQMAIVQKFQELQVGRTLRVVVEGYDRYASSYFGRSGFDAPDIDGKVFFSSERPLAVGEFLDVLITDWMDYDLLGEACTPEGAPL